MGRKREPQPKEVRTTPAGKFGARLEQLMEAAGLTTNEFAERIGVTPDTVRKYLRGAVVPDLSRWPAIAGVLGVKTIRDLVPPIPAR